MRVLVLLAILALAAAKTSKKEVLEPNTQVGDKYGQQNLWQQFVPQQILQQFVPQTKYQQYVPEQMWQQYWQQNYPQQFWPQGENSQIAQFITYYFYQAHQNKFTPAQFSSYLIKQGFPEAVVNYLTEQYEAFQNQPSVQSPSQTFQFYYENGVPQVYYQWFAQRVLAFHPYQQEQYYEQYPTSWKINSPKTVQYQGEQQYQYLPYSSNYQSESQYYPRTQGFENYGSQYPSTYQYGPYQQGSYGYNFNQLNKPYQYGPYQQYQQGSYGYNFNQLNKPYQYGSYQQAYPYNYLNRQGPVVA